MHFCKFVHQLPVSHTHHQLRQVPYEDAWDEGSRTDYSEGEANEELDSGTEGYITINQYLAVLRKKALMPQVIAIPTCSDTYQHTCTELTDFADSHTRTHINAHTHTARTYTGASEMAPSHFKET